MALRPANNARNSASAGRPQSEKAIGFLNINLPTRDNKSLRLVAVPLLESNETHMQLFNYLTVDDKGKELTEEVKTKRYQTLAARITVDLGIPRSDEDRALAL